MMNWSDFWSCSIRLLSIFAVLFFLLAFQSGAQNTARSDLSLEASLKLQPSYSMSSAVADTTINGTTYPDPKSVLFKSLFIPGWGQVINKQTWKVPIIYGLLAGLTGYSIYLTKTYHDYRAAYYNQNTNTPDDMRFGPTPDYLMNANLSSLRSSRNSLRNRRDFIYVTIALAYGLNAIDAFIFAHLRTFDVSEDLSMRTTLKPNVLAYTTPGVTLSVELFNKNK